MRAPTPWVLPLAAVGAKDLALVGGKASNLGELIRSGFPVPDGFVVSTTSYRETLTAAGLAPPGEDPLGHGAEPAQLESAIRSVELLPSVADAILSAYRELGEGPVAVRSSATAEDLRGAAFAGQQESFLNVIGPEAVLQAVRGCWASLWSKRAVAYRRRFSQDRDPAMAVVVQRMVAAEFAGVLFTANPVTGARDDVVIEASPGLGEAVVSGLVTPEHVVVDGHGRIRERRAGRQEVVIRSSTSGGVVQEQGDHVGEALPPSVLQDLAELGVKIATHFGRPQDIEWAYAEGTVWVVQARPLTALPPAPMRVSLPRRTAAAVCAELLPIRPFPLDLTAWTLPGWFAILVKMVAELPAIHVDVEAVLPESNGVVTQLVPPHLRPTWRTLTAPLRFRARLHGHDPARWTADPRFGAFERELAELSGLDLTALGWTELMAVPNDVLDALDRFVDLRIDYLPAVAAGLLRLRAWLAVLGALSEFWPLVAGQVTQTRAANDRLQTIAQQVRGNQLWAEAFAGLGTDELLAAVWHEQGFGPLRDALETWLAAYGHRETTSPALISSPTWIEDPRLLLETLRGLAVQAPVPNSNAGPAAAEQRIRRRWLARITRSDDRVIAAAASARAGIAFREDSHFHALRLRPVIRSALLEAGRRLADAGVLAAVEDIFHLKLDELRRLGDPSGLDDGQRRQLGELVRDRSLKRAEFGEAPLISPATLHPGVLRPAANALAAGTPGGGGRATGPVRVIHGPAEFGRLRPGEVLVCPYTNPSWTPLFQLAAAVVADSGSFASHAAIVAREYGIPAVMGTGNGTAVLQDGLLVVVDGSRGDVVAATAGPGHG